MRLHFYSSTTHLGTTLLLRYHSGIILAPFSILPILINCVIVTSELYELVLIKVLKEAELFICYVYTINFNILTSLIMICMLSWCKTLVCVHGKDGVAESQSVS